ncbi:MAG: glycosyltransferase family A protein, partial [Bacteroidota bacterium]
MESPFVTVLVTAYNAEKYLPEAIESVLNQTYTDFELILVNDGSKDRTLEIMEEYQKKDARIVI